MEELKEALERLGGLSTRHPDTFTRRLFVAVTWATWVLVGVIMAIEVEKVLRATASPALSTTLVKKDTIDVPAAAVVLVDDALVMHNITCALRTLGGNGEEHWRSCDWSRSACTAVTTVHVTNDTCLLDGTAAWMGVMPPRAVDGEGGGYAQFHKTTFVQQNQLLVVVGAVPRGGAGGDDDPTVATVGGSPPMVTFHNAHEMERAYKGQEQYWSYIPEDTVIKYVAMGNVQGNLAYYFTPSVIRRINGDEEWTYDFTLASASPRTFPGSHYGLVAIPASFNVRDAEEYISYGVSDAVTAIGGAVGIIGAIRSFFFTTKNDDDEHEEITYLRFSKAWRRRDSQVLREELLHRPADPTYSEH